MPPRGPLTVTVTFGPSRSPNFRRALAYARRFANDAREMEPGRWRAAFFLKASDPSRFARAGRLIAFTVHWRMTDVEVAGEPEVPWVAQAMAHCAHSQARAFGECRFRYWSQVPPRCLPCPLFDPERAARQIAAGERERGLSPGTTFSITFDPEALPEVPDYPPEGWSGE